MELRLHTVCFLSGADSCYDGQHLNICTVQSASKYQSPLSPKKVVVYFTYFGGRYAGRQMSRAKFLSDRQIFLRTLEDQYRNRQVVDQCSLWNGRPQGAETSRMCVCSKSVCKKYRAEGVYYCRYIQFIRISVFVQSRRVHLFIVNCLLKNKFNTHVIYYLYIHYINQIFTQRK